MALKNKLKVAIVDDDADDREIIRDAFISNNPEQDCLFIENGERLMDYLNQCKAEELPGIILMDLNMPGKDGREALREIKGSDKLKAIPIVVFTTSSSGRDRQMVYNLGANCFITKPDTYNKMVELAESITRLWLPE
jgi:CheY-like chemotaxis protein